MDETTNDATTILTLLYELQQLEFSNKDPDEKTKARIAELRSQIAPQYLRHYDRLKARGRKGVSLVRNGVCTECRMALPTGIWNTVQRGDDICVCDHCARYLMLDPALRTQLAKETKATGKSK